MLFVVLLLLLLDATLQGQAACPAAGPVTADVVAVGCTDVQLAVAADNVTLTLEGALGSISITSDRAGTILHLRDSTLSGNISLLGPHSFVEVLRSTVTGGGSVVVLTGTRNVTITVTDSTLAGADVASIVASTTVVGASITVTNSTLTATRYVASIIAGGSMRDVVIVTSSSHLVLSGRGSNVGVLALVGPTVIRATVKVTASSVSCDVVGDAIGILGAGTREGVTWTTVVIAVEDSNVTSTARDFVGILGAGCLNGAVTWTDVNISISSGNVTSTAGNYVGLLGAGGNSGVDWVKVSISCIHSSILSITKEVVGLLGSGSYERVSWTRVTISAARTRVGSTATSKFAGVIGTGCNNGVSWSKVTISASEMDVTSSGSSYTGILGAATNSDVAWTQVTVSAEHLNITSAAWDVVGLFGATSNSRLLTWTDVAIVAMWTSLSTTANDRVAILGTATSNPSTSTWKNTIVVVAMVSIVSQAKDVVGVLGAASNGQLSWTNVTVVAMRTNVTSAANDRVGILGTGSNEGVTWMNVTVSVVAAHLTSSANIAGILGAGSGAAVAKGINATAVWQQVVVLLIDSTLTCHHASVAGALGLGFVTRDVVSGLPVPRSSVVWRDVVVASAASNLTVWSDSSSAVLGAVAAGGEWDTVVAAAVEASRVLVRVISPAGSAVLGAAGNWSGVVLVNDSDVIDTNTSLVCSSQTIELCPTHTLPTFVTELIARARRFEYCGSACAAPPPDTTSELARPSTSDDTTTATATTGAAVTTAGMAAASTTITGTTNPPPQGMPTATGTTTTAARTGATLTVAPQTTTTSVVSNSTLAATESSSTTLVISSMTTSATLPPTTAAPTERRTHPPTLGDDIPQQRQVVETSALVASAALGVVAAPLAANKGTTMSRVLAGRECRWAEPEPDSTQFVFVFELGGSSAAGALISTVLLQLLMAGAAAVCAKVGCCPHVLVLHLAVLSYYGPNVVALATALLSSGDPSAGRALAVSGALIVNAAFLGVAVSSASSLTSHHRPLWKDARDPLVLLTRSYGAVDLLCAFLVAVVAGLRGLGCGARGGLICAVCFTNLAYSAMIRPLALRVDNNLSAVSALLLCSLSVLTTVAPREPRYDEAVLAAAAVCTAWLYLLLVWEVAVAVRKGVCPQRRRRSS